MKVIILRGIPGSGKSTYIQKHLSNALICSADHYHINEHGEYIFNINKAAAAHKTCKDKFKQAISDKIPLIVVDNTNTTIKEMNFYIQTAKQQKYEIECIRLDTPLNVAANRNQHKVPFEVIKAMYERMATVPNDWNEKIITETN